MGFRKTFKFREMFRILVESMNLNKGFQDTYVGLESRFVNHSRSNLQHTTATGLIVALDWQMKASL